jgi:VanZ family protein
MNNKLSFRRKVTLILLVLYWPTLFILAHIPIPQFVRQAHVSDKSLHFIAYLILVFLLWFTISPDRRVSWRRTPVWWVLWAVIVYGFADELIQGCVGRSCDIRDFAADLAAVITGLILLSFFTFWPAALLVAGATIFGITNVSRANLADVLPITNAMFHLFGYAIFTLLWLQFIDLHLATKPPKPRWLIIALALPMGFLLAVKLFSAILGRGFRPMDVILAVVGVVAVVAAIYLTTLFRRRFTRGFPPNNSSSTLSSLPKG